MFNFNFLKINNEYGHKYTERWLKKHKPNLISIYDCGLLRFDYNC